MNGLFITFEGVEGSGKSTQIRLLSEHLTARGSETLLLREPGATRIGEGIRAILLAPEHSEIAPATELLLYEAARAQLVAEQIYPALAAGQVVLCDRFTDSTMAYQGLARGIGMHDVEMLNRYATGDLVPHRTYLLDLTVAEGLERARERGRRDRIEQESHAFHETVRRAYLSIAASDPHRVRVIAANRPVESIAAEIAADIDAYLDSP